MKLSRQAFTLIELLVVVAIIALLIAIIMPSLSQARDAARRVACASNIHQLTIATFTYATEHRGLIPADETRHNGNWLWDLTTGVTDALIDRTGKKNDVFYDPALPEHNADLHWTYNAEFRVTGYWFTYKRVNGPMAGIPQFETGHPWIERITQRHRRFASLTLIADATLSANFEFTGIMGGSPIPHRTPHLDSITEKPIGGNVGRLDGSVQWQRFDAMEIQLANPEFWF